MSGQSYEEKVAYSRKRVADTVARKKAEGTFKADTRDVDDSLEGTAARKAKGLGYKDAKTGKQVSATAKKPKAAKKPAFKTDAYGKKVKVNSLLEAVVNAYGQYSQGSYSQHQRKGQMRRGRMHVARQRNRRYSRNALLNAILKGDDCENQMDPGGIPATPKSAPGPKPKSASQLNKEAQTKAYQATKKSDHAATVARSKAKGVAAAKHFEEVKAKSRAALRKPKKNARLSSRAITARGATRKPSAEVRDEGSRGRLAGPVHPTASYGPTQTEQHELRRTRHHQNQHTANGALLQAVLNQ